MSELPTRVRHIADEHHWREDYPGEETLRGAADRIDQLETALREVSQIDRDCKSEYDAPNALLRAGHVARSVIEAE